jgi:hypothetical protein
VSAAQHQPAMSQMNPLLVMLRQHPEGTVEEKRHSEIGRHSSSRLQSAGEHQSQANHPNEWMDSEGPPASATETAAQLDSTSG